MINKFRGEYFFLSNMYPSPVTKTLRNFQTGEKKEIVFTCAEALFQASKTLSYSEWLMFDGVDGKTAKRLGRTVTLREMWDSIRVHEMELVIHEKFQNRELADKLLATGQEELVEGNTWGDTFWGVCNGKGENHLGKILMAERAHITVERMDEQYEAWCKEKGLNSKDNHFEEWLNELYDVEDE